jgi:aerobic carbon-monoxide dehydrogenase large subunit
MIGQSLRRREDLPLLRGQGRYVDDLDLPGLAHVAFVRCHDARARILEIRALSSAPGLLRVFTAAEERVDPARPGTRDDVRADRGRPARDRRRAGSTRSRRSPGRRR